VERGFVAPSAHYLGLIQRAAREHGFPEAYRHWLDGVSVVEPGRGTDGGDPVDGA
jgi:hypothetical protein